ncbi:hypothetical protein DFJ73DRAFT_958883 [Zopfochytrium polystomum]|nr:hypothetical protein DFJ73DRAFT_958883 [Zopfochytrium polystomum]
MAAAMMHYSRSSSFASSRRSSYIEAAAAAADTTTTTTPPAHLSSSADNLPSPAAAATAATIAAAAAAAGDHSHNNSSLGTAAFGLTPPEITAAVDARDTALLEERWGGVVGVAMRLRTDPERGLSEAMEPATLDGVGAPWWAAAAAMAARARGGGGGGRTAPFLPTQRSRPPPTPIPDAEMGRTPAAATDSFLVRNRTQKSVWEFAFEALKDKTLIVLCVAAFVDLAIGIYKSGFAEQREPAAYVDGIAILFAVVVIVLISGAERLPEAEPVPPAQRLLAVALQITTSYRDGKTREMPTASILVATFVKSRPATFCPRTASLEVEVEETPLQAKLGKLADAISLFGLGAALVMVLGLRVCHWRWSSRSAHATLRMLKDNNLVRHLKAFWQLEVCLILRSHSFTTPIPITPTITLSSSSPTPQRTLGRGSSSRVTLSSDFDHHNELNDTNLLVPGRPIGSATHLLVPGAGSSRRSRDDASSISYTPSLNAPPTPTNAGTPNDPVKLANGSGGAPDFIAGTRLPEVVVNHVARCINLNTTAEEVAAPPLADDEGSSDGEDDVGAGGSSSRWALAATAARQQRQRQRSGVGFSVADITEKLASGVAGQPQHERNAQQLDEYPPPRCRRPPKAVAATEVALLEFTDKRLRRNYKPDRERSEVVMVLPFSSERKRMSTIIKVPSRERDGKLEQALFGASHDPTLGTVGGKRWSRGEKYWLFCKGAAEIVLQSCDRYLNDEGKAMPITPEIRAELEALIEGMASSALRTICVAFKPFRGSVAKLAGEDPAKSEPTLIPPPLASPPTITISGSADGDSKPPPLSIAIDTSAATLDHPGNGGYSSDDTDATEGEPTDPDAHGLILASVLGIEDPLRPEVPAAIADCARAGIVVRMVTGDNMATARSIARQAGILPASSSAGGSSTAYPQVMEGPAFRALSPEEQDEDKQVLVQRLKKLGETVAVTGDGTNDAPALRMADVGFSMGIAGTEVAKEASDIILLDDNFVSLSKAIVWGRSVYDSVRKFLQFQLTVNVVAVLLAMYPNPSSRPWQLLWVNLIMDTFAALALATDRPTPDLLDRPPSRRTDPLISRDMLLMILGQSLYQLVACLTLYCGYSGIMRDRRINYDDLFDGVDPVTETVVFNTFVFCQVFNEINCRVIGSKLNVFKGITQNSYFVGIFVMTVVVQIVIVQAGGVAFKNDPRSKRGSGPSASPSARCRCRSARASPARPRRVRGLGGSRARVPPRRRSASRPTPPQTAVPGRRRPTARGRRREGEGMAGATYLALPPPQVVIVSRPSMSE